MLVLFLKAPQPGLWRGVPERPGLRRELRTDRQGHSQHRWVQTERKVRHFTATSSSMAGRHPDLGVMVNALTTGTALGVKEGRTWGMDNGAYSGRFDPDALLDALDKFRPHRQTCRFVVAPDVLGDGAATEALYPTWRAVIRRAGYPVAFVAHRGTTRLPDCDALFVPAMNLDDPNIPRLVEEARRAGKWVHVGRVNSAERTASMFRLGADSVDGTHTRFEGVDQGTKNQGAWMDAANAQARQPTLLTEDRGLESEEAYAARRAQSRKQDAAAGRGAQLVSDLGDEAHAGMLVAHVDGRVGVLLAPPEDGQVVVSFPVDPMDPEGEDELSLVPADELHGPVSLAAPNTPQELTHRQMVPGAKIPKSQRSAR